MPLADADLAWIRSHVVWVPPEDQELHDLYDDPDYGGSLAGVAVWFLRRKQSEYLAVQADMSLPGGIRLNASKNLDILEGRLKQLGVNVPSDPDSAPGAVTVLGLRRAGVDRG